MRRFREMSPVWIFMPWNNLGCFGLRLGRGFGWLYTDLVCTGCCRGQLYFRIGHKVSWAARYRSNITRFWRWRKVR